MPYLVVLIEVPHCLTWRWRLATYTFERASSGASSRSGWFQNEFGANGLGGASRSCVRGVRLAGPEDPGSACAGAHSRRTPAHVISARALPTSTFIDAPAWGRYRFSCGKALAPQSGAPGPRRRHSPAG